MGAGKSTIGAALAARFQVALCDTDDEIERRSGRSIPQIFADDGEAAFRALEADVVADVIASHDGVVSLGGGAVMTEAVRGVLTEQAVVYLEIGPTAGFARVAHSNRPLLAAPDPAARYADLLAQRAPTYRAVAAVVVNADRDPRMVVDDIVARLADVPSDSSDQTQ
ncbi:shikimate kinase [Gordonia hydrophobica]|uniref:Shikimate kinase n=1 Tax=Gordonia hydrophobica TaxID=40516 RepID=A0ABZ2UBD5_9ACTN|nr:shikimate kinase [Gordonia hydrophobica]